jgi:hypothetical protein
MRVMSSVGVFLLALFIVALPVPSHAQIAVGISIRIAPPVLPVYTQPACPGDGYLWTPGYWAYGPDGYYWVPGTWVRPPQIGVLWTPGYWGWGGGVYAWHAGYWGPHIGFYGGVNYGFGYVGVGYVGGEWNGGVFRYNTAVNNINVTVVHNTYNRTVINNTTVVNRVSFNGGAGGINVRPTPAEESAGREQHFGATNEQTTHEHAASTNRAQFASVNHGQPGVAATGRAGQFSGKDVVAARGGGAPAGANRPAAYRPPNAGGGNAGGNARTVESTAPRGNSTPPNRNAGGTGSEVHVSNQPVHQITPSNNAPKSQGKPAPQNGGGHGGGGGEPHEKNEH